MAPTTANVFLKNTAWMTVSKFIEHIFSYVIIIFISRYLGAEGLGQYSFIFSFVGFFFIFSDWGLNALLMKDVAKNKRLTQKYANNVMSLKAFLTAISFGIFFIVLFFIGKEDIRIALIIVGVLELTRIFQITPLALLRTYHQGKFLAIAGIVERSIALVGVIVLLPLISSITMLVVILLVSYSIYSALLFIYSLRFFKFNPELDWPLIFRLFRRGFPFLLVSFFSIVFIRLDTIMLSFMQSDLVVGWYNAGYKFINITNVFTTLFLFFGFPLFSELATRNKKYLRLLVEQMLYYLIAIIFPAVVVVFFFGDFIIEFIYSFTAVEATIAFKILIVAQIFVFLTTILGQLIAAADDQRVFAKIAGFGALLNIILNFILIPPFSLYGAGFATLFTYAFMFVLMRVYVHQKVMHFSIIKKIAFPTVLSLLLVPFFFFSPFSWWLSLLLGVAFYVAIFLWREIRYSSAAKLFFSVFLPKK